MKASDYKSEFGRLLVSASVSAIVLASITSPARADDAAPPQLAAADSQNGQLEEIVVTSRKRSEKLIDVPVSVTALTEKALEDEGISTIKDIAAASPGLTVNSTLAGSGRNDRSFPIYTIRGMTPSSITNPTASVFLDGAPVPSGQVDAVDDVERVEVLKGPQSAYFGRETFAGAISIVTKDPSDTFGGSISGLVGSRNYTDFRATVEGPIVPGKLDARLSLRSYATDGSYVNAAAPAYKASTDETLGDQSTKSASLEFVAKPVDNLKIKGVAIYWNDDDGPGAQGLITPAQANCKFNVSGTIIPYFCGSAPSLLSNSPAANTVVDAGIRQFLSGIGETNLVNPGSKLNHFGLEREAYHMSLGTEYDITSLGFTISTTTAVDKQEFVELQDLDNADTSASPLATFGAQSFYNWPFIVEQRYRDLSQDIRFSSDPGGPLTWTVGGNYSWVRSEQSLSGGGPYGIASYPAGPNESTTLGAYFGLSYDILDNVTLNFDGRYQLDELTAFYANLSPQVSGYYHNFLPRATVQYKITPDVMAYVTYSEGVNPGTFNTGLQSLSASDQALAASLYGAKTVVAPEYLRNYELGVKGKFFDGKATLSADIYDDQWTSQIVSNSFILPTPAGVAPNLQSAFVNNGSTHLKGVEIDGTAVPIPHVTLNGGAAINDSKITGGLCLTCAAITGSSIVSGNQLPNSSKYQATFGAEYSNVVPTMEDWKWFARMDYSYKSGVYDTASNTVKTPDINVVNLRIGADSGTLRLEAFVDNVTNNGSYTNFAQTAYLAGGSFTTNSLVAGLPPLRTYGIRVKYYFDAGETSVAAPLVSPPIPAPVAAAPAPAPVAKVEAQRSFQVFFDFDKSDITAAAAQVIQAAADSVKAGNVVQITVTGHTDTVGSAAYNQGLSERRATAVKTGLVADGVSAGEVTTVGVGKAGLLVPTGDGVREPQNRRAEIVLQ